MKTYCVSGGIAPHILNLSTRCRRLTPRHFTPRKEPRYPLDGPQGLSGSNGVEKNSLYGRIILEWILEKQSAKVYTGVI